jgi:3-phosphoglycerate kinase
MAKLGNIKIAFEGESKEDLTALVVRLEAVADKLGKLLGTDIKELERMVEDEAAAKVEAQKDRDIAARAAARLKMKLERLTDEARLMPRPQGDGDA